MKKLNDLSNVDNLSVKNLFQIRGGASVAEPVCSSRNCSTAECNSSGCISSSCTSAACKTLICSTKSTAVSNE